MRRIRNVHPSEVHSHTLVSGIYAWKFSQMHSDHLKVHSEDKKDGVGFRQNDKKFPHTHLRYMKKSPFFCIPTDTGGYALRSRKRASGKKSSPSSFPHEAGRTSIEMRSRQPLMSSKWPSLARVMLSPACTALRPRQPQAAEATGSQPAESATFHTTTQDTVSSLYSSL